MRTYQRFAIAGHVGPDGDSIGSSMGLALALHKLGKDAMVVVEKIPQKYTIIPGKHFIWNEPLEKLDAEVLFVLDCGDAKRMGSANMLLEKIPISICIDHHETNNGFAQYNFIDADASSTAEMVLELIELITEVDIEIATAIYAGIVCDTGGFRYSATGRNTLENTARLMDTGIPFTDIYSELMNKRNFASTKALGVAIGNAKQSMDGRIVYSSVTRADLAKVGAVPSDLEGTAEYLMSTRGAEVAFFIYEKDTPPDVKVSLRSYSLHVGHFAAQFGGGGHRLAAGCMVQLPVDKVLPQILASLESELLADDNK